MNMNPPRAKLERLAGGGPDQNRIADRDMDTRIDPLDCLNDVWSEKVDRNGPLRQTNGEKGDQNHCPGGQNPERLQCPYRCPAQMTVKPSPGG